MPLFHYTAIDSAGRPVSGDESAVGSLQLHAVLTARGLTAVRIERVNETTESAAVSEDGPAATPITEWEAVSIAQQVADFARTGLPLEGGLLALAEEAPSRRLKWSLTRMSRDLQGGMSLEQVFSRKENGLPPHLVQLVRAGLASGSLPYALDQYVQSARRAKSIRHHAWLALAYPLAVVAGSMAIVLFYMLAVVPEFRKIYADFNTELPWITNFFMSVSVFLTDQWYLAAPLAALLLVATAFAAYAVNHSVMGRTLICSMPLVGPMLRLTALAEFCQLLGQLIATRTPLPAALELAGEGCGDKVIAHACHGLAHEVRSGVPLADAAVAVRNVPHLLRQMLCWSERPQKFAESLLAASEMCATRAAMQTTVLGPLFEPVAILFAAILCGLLISAIFVPLFTLLNVLA